MPCYGDDLPIHRAIVEGNLEEINIVLTKLYLSLKTKYPNPIELKSAAAEFMNKKDCDGRTPLHLLMEKYAGSTLVIPMLKTFIKYGAVADIRDAQGHTPLAIITAKGRFYFTLFEDTTIPEGVIRTKIYAIGICIGTIIQESKKFFSATDLELLNLANTGLLGSKLLETARLLFKRLKQLDAEYSDLTQQIIKTTEKPSSIIKSLLCGVNGESEALEQQLSAISYEMAKYEYRCDKMASALEMCNNDIHALTVDRCLRTYLYFCKEKRKIYKHEWSEEKLAVLDLIAELYVRKALYNEESVLPQEMWQKLIQELDSTTTAEQNTVQIQEARMPLSGIYTYVMLESLADIIESLVNKDDTEQTEKDVSLLSKLLEMHGVLIAASQQFLFRPPVPPDIGGADEGGVDGVYNDEPPGAEGGSAIIANGTEHIVVVQEYDG